MLLQKFRNVVFASIIVVSLVSCSNQGANDNSMQESSKNQQQIDESQSENVTENQDKNDNSNIGGVNLTEDGTYIASFDTGKEASEKYQDYNLKIQDDTLTVEGPLQFIASGESDDDIKNLDDQKNVFIIDQNTSFQVQDTYTQENHSQEEFQQIFEETKGKQIALFVEVLNGKAIVVNLGYKS